jgi:lactoylglutathione lyase
MFTELFPIIATTDMARALRFYRDALGGTVTHEIPGADGTPAYVGIDVGASHLGLGFNAEVGGERPRPITVWIYAEDCDAAIEWLGRNDVVIVEDPKDQPSGERVARVLDPDGNEVIISQRGGGAHGVVDSVGASLLSPEPARYTRPEFERRFLVSPGSAWRDLVEPYSKTFEDTYIRRTHLRLRVLSDSATGQEFIKLTKKLESASPYVQMTGSIPLSPLEYEFLSGLEGDRIRKVRHYHFHRGYVFSIDVFEAELAGLVMCEVEAGGAEELMQIEVPEYAAVEVTEDPFFTGGHLCRTSREDLTGRLARMGIPLLQ